MIAPATGLLSDRRRLITKHNKEKMAAVKGSALCEARSGCQRLSHGCWRWDPGSWWREKVPVRPAAENTKGQSKPVWGKGPEQHNDRRSSPGEQNQTRWGSSLHITYINRADVCFKMSAWHYITLTNIVHLFCVLLCWNLYRLNELSSFIPRRTHGVWLPQPENLWIRSRIS